MNFLNSKLKLMPNIAKTLDFTNQTINVGMDVHLNQKYGRR